MTATQLLAGVAAAIAVLAGWWAVALAGGWAGPPRVTGRARGIVRSVATGGAAGRRTARLVLALCSGIGAWAVTGWPAVGLGAAVAAVGLPVIFAAGTRSEREIARVEAVEEWARRLSDVLTIGVGLEQAIQTAARTAPDAIAAEARSLAARVSARMPTEVALRRFADELDDPTADLVVAALVLASRRRGPGVAAALLSISESVSEEVAARRRIEADRAKPRTTARAVTVITLVVMGVGLLNRGYTQPYSSPLGQLILAATIGFFAAALWWMHSMTLTTRPARVLDPGGAR